VTLPPSPRRRKTRLVRRGEVLEDLLVVIRAMPADRARGVEEMVDRAVLSAATYVVERDDGGRDLLYGVSVFAHRPGRELTDVLYRFPAAPTFVAATVGAIRQCGLQVFPTGSNTDHFDVQLIPGVSEADEPPSEGDVRAAADRLLEGAGDMRPNPSYAVGPPTPLEEE
jgi:hypothetical protein